VLSGARIQVEGKDTIKKRLGRSTDYGDAVVMAFWEDREPVKTRAAFKTVWSPQRKVGIW